MHNILASHRSHRFLGHLPLERFCILKISSANCLSYRQNKSNHTNNVALACLPLCTWLSYFSTHEKKGLDKYLLTLSKR